MGDGRTESSTHETQEVLSCSTTESVLAHSPLTSLVNKHREKRVRELLAICSL